MRLLLKIKYPKLLFLLLTFILAYIIFIKRDFLPLHDILLSMGFLGTFIAGIFFPYGFTAAPATAILLILSKEQNIFLAGIIGGFGALISDLIIFNFVRLSFYDEIREIQKEDIYKRISNKIPASFKRYFIPILAGFIIASPLPDEIGVSLFAASTNISRRLFSLISYTINTLGIFIILIIGNLI